MSQCQVNSRLVTILTNQVLFFMNLVDRDLTEHQITQTLTLSRLHAQLEQTRGIRLFSHPLEQTGNLSVQCSAICANPWSDFMEWIHDEYSVVEKHARWNLVWIEKYGELEQIVNIPVTQIVEEITEVNIPVLHRLWKRSQR